MPRLDRRVDGLSNLFGAAVVHLGQRVRVLVGRNHCACGARPYFLAIDKGRDVYTFCLERLQTSL